MRCTSSSQLCFSCWTVPALCMGRLHDSYCVSSSGANGSQGSPCRQGSSYCQPRVQRLAAAAAAAVATVCLHSLHRMGCHQQQQPAEVGLLGARLPCHQGSCLLVLGLGRTCGVTANTGALSSWMPGVLARYAARMQCVLLCVVVGNCAPCLQAFEQPSSLRLSVVFMALTLAGMPSWL